MGKMVGWCRSLAYGQVHVERGFRIAAVLGEEGRKLGLRGIVSPL